jgi:hypothetical protein
MVETQFRSGTQSSSVKATIDAADARQPMFRARDTPRDSAGIRLSRVQPVSQSRTTCSISGPTL